MSVSNTTNNNSASIGTSAAQIVLGRSSREALLVQNLGTADLYVGGSTVTTANGVKVAAGSAMGFSDFNGPLYGISASGTLDVRYLESY